MNILFLARSMDIGGAERQLALLATSLREAGHGIKVAVFYQGGPLEAELPSKGVTVIHLDKRGRWDLVSFPINLVRAVRRENPDVVYGWMIIPNVLISMLRPFFPQARIVWGIRTSYLDWSHYDWPPRVAARLEGWLSRWADLIICNSSAGKDYAAQRGLPEARMKVIPNGIDTGYFQPQPHAGAQVRSAWKVKRDESLIGLVGRIDPMKDHPTFLKAAALMSAGHPEVRFVCVGDGPEAYKAELLSLAQSLGLENRLIWSGERDDMPGVYSALDILVSSSYGEGFPNTIGEAMACGVPCVVTDVGDSARIVGDTGLTVPPKQPETLNHGMSAMLGRLATDRASLSERTRRRILEAYNLESMISATVAALLATVGS